VAALAPLRWAVVTVILHGILKNRAARLYIDDGRPLPQLFHKTVANLLRRFRPTAMFKRACPATISCANAIRERPRPWRQRVQTDGQIELCRSCNFAGHALKNLYRLTSSITGPANFRSLSGYGTTETAPTISTTHWATDQPGGDWSFPRPGPCS